MSCSSAVVLMRTKRVVPVLQVDLTGESPLLMPDTIRAQYTYVYNPTTNAYHPIQLVGGIDAMQLAILDQAPPYPGLNNPLNPEIHFPQGTLQLEEFPTVSAMVNSPNSSWKLAACTSYTTPGDNDFSFWVRVATTDLDPNEDETVVALTAGGFARRVSTI